MRNADETSASDITLTPGTDGVSDYQQYLEKTSRRDSRGDASPLQTCPIGDGDIPQHNSPMDGPAPTLNNGGRLGLSALPMLKKVRRTHARTEREQRPHRLEVNEAPHEYPGPLALSLLTLGICLSVFLVSLDRTIVATVRASCELLGNIASELIPSSQGRTAHN